VVELPDHEQRVGTNARGQDRRAARDVHERCDLQLVAVGDAHRARRLAIDDDAVMAAHVARDLVHVRDRHVAAGVELHALGRQQPERKLVGVATRMHDRPLPARGHVVPGRQELVLGKLLVPPMHSLLVQPARQLQPRAHQALLVRQLEAQALLDHRRIQVPAALRIRTRVEAVFLEPGEVAHLRAVRHRPRRCLALGVPDRIGLVHARRIEREVETLAAQRNAAGAPIDRFVVPLEQPGAPCKLAADPCEIARLSQRLDRRLAQHETLVLPVLLDELRATEADQLRALEVGGLGQQHVGHPVRLVHGVGERDHERKARDGLDEVPCVPEGDRRIGAKGDPDVRVVRLRPVRRRVLREHPRQVRGSERLRPRTVAGQWHERAMRVAPVAPPRLADPVNGVGRIQLVVQEAVGAGPHALHPVLVRTVDAHRGAERAARHFERADQHCEHRARPAALERAPAVVHRLAERDRDRPVRQRAAVDLDRCADRCRVDVFVRHAADRLGIDLAQRSRPLRAVGADVRKEPVECRRRTRLAMVPAFLVGTLLEARADDEIARQRRDGSRVIVDNGSAARRVENERLAALRIAQVEAVRADEVRRGGAIAQERQIQIVTRPLVQHHVDQREQERRIGLRLDRNPFSRHRAGHRQVRLDHDTACAARTRVRLAHHGRRPARDLDVGAEREVELHQRRVGRDREGAVPILAVQVLGMDALDALPGAEAVVDRAPGGEKGRKGAHVVRRRPAVSETDGESRVAVLVGQPAFAHLVQPRGDEIERFVPRDRHETRVLVDPLARIGATHRREDAIRAVRLLDQPVGLHAGTAVGGVDPGSVVIRCDRRRNAVAHLDAQQVGTGYAVVAVGVDETPVADGATRLSLQRHRRPPSRRDIRPNEDPAKGGDSIGFFSTRKQKSLGKSMVCRRFHRNRSNPIRGSSTADSVSFGTNEQQNGGTDAGASSTFAC